MESCAEWLVLAILPAPYVEVTALPDVAGSGNVAGVSGQVSSKQGTGNCELTGSRRVRDTFDGDASVEVSRSR